MSDLHDKAQKLTDSYEAMASEYVAEEYLLAVTEVAHAYLLLERRAACAEELAAACIEYFGPLTHHALCSSRQGKGCDCYSSRKVKVYAALAAFEATKKKS